MQLHSVDRGINRKRKPVGTGLEVKLDALAWRPSDASRFVLNSANLKGVLEGGAVDVQRRGIARLLTVSSKALPFFGGGRARVWQERLRTSGLMQRVSVKRLALVTRGAVTTSGGVVL